MDNPAVAIAAIRPPRESEPSTPPDDDTLVGQTIAGRYRIDQLLAVGGMGRVYRGEHIPLRKRVAIKVLRPGIENLPELVARFEREAIAGAHIQHPNVDSATDFGVLDDGSYFLVLEYIKGTTLHRALKKQGRFEPVRAARIARQIAAGLGATHRMGVVHRDVKPRNVMLESGPDEVVKIIDFGLAKMQLGRLSTVTEGPSNGDEARISDVGMVFGTIAYLAPEAMLGMDAVDERSDLYALGVILFKMLAGKHPFEATEAAELFQAQRSPPLPIAVRTPGASVPEAIEAVARRLLERDPAKRFQTAEEAVEALDAALAGGEVVEGEVAREGAGDAGGWARRRWVGMVVACVCVAVLAAVAWYLAQVP